MDNRTFNELLQEGEIDLILMDGPEALTKKQLKIVQKTIDSVGRNIPETMQKKASFNPMKMVEMLGAGVSGISSRLMGRSTQNNQKKLKESNPPKSGKINKVFYTIISEGKNTRLRRGDTVAAILAKMLNFIKQVDYEKRKKYELYKDFEKERIDESARESKNIFKMPTSTVPKKAKNSLVKDEGFNLFNFSNIIKTLGAIGLLVVVDEAQAKLNEFVETIASIKQKIKDKFAKITDFFRNIDILGYKPFESVLGPSKKEITNAGSLAELVRQHEGGTAGYDALVIPKGGIPKEFQDYKPSEMTLSEVLKLQDKMLASKKFPSSAVGGYQIIKSTLLGAIDFLDLDLNTKYDKNTQDKIFNEYLITQKQSKVGAYLRGESGSSLEEAQMGLAQEFSSFPSPKDISGRGIKKGESYYKGTGDNAASISLESSASALNQAKSLQETNTASSSVSVQSLPKLNLTPKTPEQPPLTNIPKLDTNIPNRLTNGDKISNLSIINENLNEQMVSSVVMINNSTNTNIIGNDTQQQVFTVPSLLDLPYISKGNA